MATDHRQYPDDFYPKLLGAIFPEAVRQAKAERARQYGQRLEEAYHAYVLGWGVGLRGDPAIPLHTWRSHTPAEVAEYDRRFLHVLGITPL